MSSLCPTNVQLPPKKNPTVKKGVRTRANRRHPHRITTSAQRAHKLSTCNGATTLMLLALLRRISVRESPKEVRLQKVRLHEPPQSLSRLSGTCRPRPRRSWRTQCRGFRSCSLQRRLLHARSAPVTPCGRTTRKSGSRSRHQEPWTWKTAPCSDSQVVPTPSLFHWKKLAATGGSHPTRAGPKGHSCCPPETRAARASLKRRHLERQQPSAARRQACANH